MLAEEIQDRTVGLCFGDGIAKAIRRQAGQVEQALRPFFVRQHPSQCCQSQSRGILNRIFRGVTDCN